MSDIYENREYIIFNVSELPLVNFNEVLETSVATVRKSVDKTKTFVKWDGATPDCVNNLTTKEGPYTYEEMLTILATPEWTDPNPPFLPQ
jgi:hypothetical protein